MLRGLCRIGRALRDILRARRRLEHLSIDMVHIFLDAVDARQLFFHAVRDIDDRLRDALRRLRRLLRAGRELFRGRRDLVGRLRDMLQEFAQVLCHLVKGMCEVTELVIGIDRAVIDAKVALRKFFRMRFEHGNRARDAVRKNAADAEDEDDAEDCHDSERNLHRRHFRIDDAFRHGQHHDPARTIHRRIRHDRRRAVDIVRERAFSVLHHFVKVRTEARDFRDVLVAQALVLRGDDFAGRRDDRAAALALVVQLVDVIIHARERDVLADGARKGAIRLVVRRRNRDAGLLRARRDIRVGVNRLARRFRIAVPRALVRNQLACQIALERRDDVIVRLARDRDVEHHVILRVHDDVLRRLFRQGVERSHMRRKVFIDARMRRDPARNALPLRFHIRRDFALDARIECPIRHEIAQKRDDNQHDADNPCQRHELLLDSHE